MSSDIVVSHVTFSSREIGPRLAQRWRFVAIHAGKVLIKDEPIATFDKTGGTVTLSPLGPREAVRWLAWAITEICPEAEAYDEEASPPTITAAPMPDDDVEKLAEDIVLARNDAIAKEADPSGGAHEAVALVVYLVKRELLELAGSTAAVARAVMPLLAKVDDEIGGKLEDVLLDLDEVEELYADGDQLTKIVQNNDHIFGR